MGFNFVNCKWRIKYELRYVRKFNEMNEIKISCKSYNVYLLFLDFS